MQLPISISAILLTIGCGSSTGKQPDVLPNDASSPTDAPSADGGPDPMLLGDSPQGDCDGTLAMDSTDAMDGARAIGLCQVAVDGSWGVVRAAWVRSDGLPLVGDNLDLGRGILDRFGSVGAQEGGQLLSLSTGTARAPGTPGFMSPEGFTKSGPHGAPEGFPKESPACPGIVTGAPHDSAGLLLTIRTPIDAKSLHYRFNFFTYEYPVYICSTFNDFFVTIMSPAPTGLVDGNVSFDNLGNAVSVNSAFIEACQPCNTGGRNFSCPLGYEQLVGTGFDAQQAITPCAIQGSGATGWLETSVPIENPGEEITLLFTVWDSGDGVLDSTVLIDSLRFDRNEASLTTRPVAAPQG